MKYLLHIDTSTDTGAIAVCGGGNLLAYSVNEQNRNHAATLNTMINDILEDIKISFEDVSAIVVCGGPGSYTGLRIGLATAKGLCYAMDKPLISDNRLTLLAYQCWRKNGGNYSGYISLLIARNKEYFISIYDNNFKCTLAPQLIMEEQLNNLLENDKNAFIISNVPEDVINKPGVNNFTIDANITIDLKSWGTYAFNEYCCHNIANFANLEPFYLKQVYTHK